MLVLAHCSVTKNQKGGKTLLKWGGIRWAVQWLCCFECARVKTSVFRLCRLCGLKGRIQGNPQERVREMEKWPSVGSDRRGHGDGHGGRGINNQANLINSESKCHCIKCIRLESDSCSTIDSQPAIIYLCSFVWAAYFSLSLTAGSIHLRVVLRTLSVIPPPPPMLLTKAHLPSQCVSTVYFIFHIFCMDFAMSYSMYFWVHRPLWPTSAVNATWQVFWNTRSSARDAALECNTERKRDRENVMERGRRERQSMPWVTLQLTVVDCSVLENCV